MKPRICPYCLHIETPDANIIAVYNGKRGRTCIGGCMCPECDGAWVELAHPDGRTELKLKNGRMVDEAELRAHVEAMQADAEQGAHQRPAAHRAQRNEK